MGGRGVRRLRQDQVRRGGGRDVDERGKGEGGRGVEEEEAARVRKLRQEQVREGGGREGGKKEGGRGVNEGGRRSST